jgi:hypothetical protein
MSRRLQRWVNGFATLAAALVAAPAFADENGRFEDSVYVAPGALFTAKSPLGPRTIYFDSFRQSTGAVTFLDERGELYGVVCTPNLDVLAGARNDFETDAAILRNWLHDATFPLFFEKQLPGAVILDEQAGHLEGRPAWFAMIHLPEGSGRLRNDPSTGYPMREDSWRALVVFTRGDHTFLIMNEVPAETTLKATLPPLVDFYQGMTFADDHPFFALNQH